MNWPYKLGEKIWDKEWKIVSREAIPVKSWNYNFTAKCLKCGYLKKFKYSRGGSYLIGNCETKHK